MDLTSELWLQLEQLELAWPHSINGREAAATAVAGVETAQSLAPDALVPMSTNPALPTRT